MLRRAAIGRSRHYSRRGRRNNVSVAKIVEVEVLKAAELVQNSLVVRRNQGFVLQA